MTVVLRRYFPNLQILATEVSSGIVPILDARRRREDGGMVPLVLPIREICLSSLTIALTIPFRHF